MPHAFGNDENRFGSAAFVTEAELEAAGAFDYAKDAVYVGKLKGRRLWFKEPSGILIVAGARAGKLRDVLAQNICHGVMRNVSQILFDVKGELAAISQNQTPDQKHCLFWNPFEMHGLPCHPLNPLDHITWSSKWLFADIKSAMAALLQTSGAPQAQFFELNARRIAEALALVLTKRNGVLTLPDLFDAVLALVEGGPRWMDIAWDMHTSGIPFCKSVEAEIHEARSDSSGGYKGIIGELQKAFAALSDPVLRDALSPPYAGSLTEICKGERAYQLYLMVPPEMIESWSGVIKTMFASAKTIKSRNPSSPPQTWIIDEAARLKKFSEVVELFTDGAGIGIRPIVILQDVTQAADLAPNALQKMSSSAGLQMLFGVRDQESCQRVSDILGAETLRFNDPVEQGRAKVSVRDLLRKLLNGSDPFQLIFQLSQKRYESGHETKQRRMQRTPDEVRHTPENRMYLLWSGLSGAVYAERESYLKQCWMAGRYHASPFHGPQDRVTVMTWFGEVTVPIIREPVPEAFADYPQYNDGYWSRVVLWQ